MLFVNKKILSFIEQIKTINILNTQEKANNDAGLICLFELLVGRKSFMMKSCALLFILNEQKQEEEEKALKILKTQISIIFLMILKTFIGFEIKPCQRNTT